MEQSVYVCMWLRTRKEPKINTPEYCFLLSRLNVDFSFCFVGADQNI